MTAPEVTWARVAIAGRVRYVTRYGRAGDPRDVRPSPRSPMARPRTRWRTVEASTGHLVAEGIELDLVTAQAMAVANAQQFHRRQLGGPSPLEVEVVGHTVNVTGEIDPGVQLVDVSIDDAGNVTGTLPDGRTVRGSIAEALRDLRGDR
jgi:hypothetical protein